MLNMIKNKLMTPEEFLKFEQDMVLKIFNEDHMILPQFAILRTTNKVEQYVIAEGFQDGNQKERYYAVMKNMCKQPNVIAAVQIMEAWCSITNSPTKAIKPSEDPNRLSVVTVVLFTKTEVKGITYLDKDGKLEMFEDGTKGEFHSTHGNPFNLINLKNKKYN